MRDSTELRKARLHHLVDSLSLERLDAAQSLLERLGSEGSTVRLGGLWSHLGMGVSEEDISEARREMWGGVGYVPY